MDHSTLARRLRTEYDLDQPRQVAAAMRFALQNGARPEILDALRYRMARARTAEDRADAAAMLCDGRTDLPPFTA